MQQGEEDEERQEDRADRGEASAHGAPAGWSARHVLTAYWGGRERGGVMAARGGLSGGPAEVL